MSRAEQSTNIYSWDNFYKKEISNFEENPEDTGECWFDDSGAESKMVDFLVDKLNDGEIDKIDTLIDLGTGNGHLLFELQEELMERCNNVELVENSKYLGVDYSEDSILFAKKIHEERDPDLPFEFRRVDILSKEEQFFEDNLGYDIILDKGTLDAIALNQDPISSFDGKIGMEVYPIQVSKLMKANTILLITSCNFTENELIKIITNDKKNDLEVWDKINYPSFKFGGAQGSTICSIAFKKK